MSSTEQEINTAEMQENDQTNYVVSFDDISATNLPFSEMYKCAKSTSGQVVQGLNHLSQHILGEGNYDGNKKEAFNEYQNELYPNMSRLALKVVAAYNEKFTNDITDPLTRQVFGANLNGNRNNGQLNKFIPCKNVNRFLSYKFAQFGQLLALLEYRLLFIVNRDPQYVKRYRENEEEMKHFETLRVKSREFCDFLKNDVFPEWTNCVSNIRSKTNMPTSSVAPVKLTADNVNSEKNNNYRTNHFSKNNNDHEYNGYLRRRQYDEEYNRPYNGAYTGSRGGYIGRKYNDEGNGNSNNEVSSRRIYSGPFPYTKPEYKR